MSASVDGVISGLDTTSLIASMVEIYSVPKDNLETQIAELEDKKSKISELVDLMGTFEDSLTDMRHLADFREFTADYADTSAFSVDVTGLAVAGSYQIAVSQVATASTEVSQGFADKSTAGELATGTMSVTYNGTSTDITIDADTTLSTLARSITAVDGLTAYIMDTGDASTPYRLVIQGDNTGDDYGITLDTSGLTGAGTVPTFTEEVTAKNAALTVNGIDVSSASNKVTSAVPGMTINVTDETTAAVDVTVSSDTDAIETKVSGLLDAYNAIVNYVADNSEYDADAETRGAFVGDSSVRRVLQGLKTTMTGQFSDLGQTYDALSLIGISSDAFTGEMSLDSDAFQAAIEDAPTEIANLFTGDGGFVDTMLTRLDVYTDSYDGSLVLRQDSLDDRISDLQDQVDTYEDRITRYETRLRAQFNALESLLGQMQGSADYMTAMFSSSSSSS